MATVLIADDDRANRELLTTLLRHGGHRVLEASDGVQALEISLLESPDAVIADILMPKMDGFEFVRRLRSDPAGAPIVVIFCTAYFMEDEVRGLAEACGASLVLEKPLEPEETLRALEEVLASPRHPLRPPLPEEVSRLHLRAITDKLAEKVDELEKVSRERERLLKYHEIVLNAAGEGIYGIDADGACTFINPAGARLLGGSTGQIVGQTAHDVMGHATADGVRYSAVACPICRSGRARNGDRDAFLKSDGTPFPVEYTSAPIVEDGFPAGAVVTFRDVTEQRAVEEARLAREAAERTKAAMNEFISHLSHEIRTPLNAVIGFAQLLELEGPSEAQRDAVTHILRGGQHLLELVNEILDISRVESGALALSIEPVLVGEVLQEACELIQPFAAARGIEFEFELPEPMFVSADRQRFKQILLNLLSNAVKYNRDRGRVRTSCDVDRDVGRVSVADTGLGIEPELLDRLFVPFDRLGAELGEVDGTGLGLTLSKKLAEAMHGSISVQSRPGTGSTFWVEVPLAEAPSDRRLGPAHEEPVAANSLVDVSGTVLYIEDNLANLTLIERVLSRFPNLKLLSAMQGSLGLDLACEHRPDLVLLDLQLPDLAGDEVLRRLREDPATSRTPVVVISADALPEQARRLLSEGARAYLTKPLDVRHFLAVVQEALAAGQTD